MLADAMLNISDRNFLNLQNNLDCFWDLETLGIKENYELLVQKQVS